MNITSFQIGDIITRSEPMTYEYNNCKDGSYMGERLIFIGADETSKLIVLRNEDETYRNGVITLPYGRDRWDDGWSYFPENLIKKAIKFIYPKKSAPKSN